jgi:hypothetical protein
MNAHTPWSAIRAKRPGNSSLQQGFRSAETASMWLAELRRQSGLTQSEMAERLGVTQGWISQIENETDIRVSTVGAYVAALGGELQLRAVMSIGDELCLDEMSVEVHEESPISAAG